MVEVIIGAGISSIVLFVGVSCFLTCMTGWIRGQTYITSESNATEALRKITTELKEAMSITVNSDGTRVDYVKPLTDGNGNYDMPVQTDGVARRIWIDNGTLSIRRGSTDWVLASNVLSTDPNTGSSYKVFTPNSGVIVRQIAVLLVTQSTGFKNEQIKSRVRESIFVRNIPLTTK